MGRKSRSARNRRRSAGSRIGGRGSRSIAEGSGVSASAPGEDARLIQEKDSRAQCTWRYTCQPDATMESRLRHPGTVSRDAVFLYGWVEDVDSTFFTQSICKI